MFLSRQMGIREHRPGSWNVLCARVRSDCVQPRFVAREFATQKASPAPMCTVSGLWRKLNPTWTCARPEQGTGNADG